MNTNELWIVAIGGYDFEIQIKAICTNRETAKRIRDELRDEYDMNIMSWNACIAFRMDKLEINKVLDLSGIKDEIER